MPYSVQDALLIGTHQAINSVTAPSMNVPDIETIAAQDMAVFRTHILQFRLGVPAPEQQYHVEKMLLTSTAGRLAPDAHGIMRVLSSVQPSVTTGTMT